MILNKIFTYKEIIAILTSHVNATLHTDKIKFSAMNGSTPMSLTGLKISAEILIDNKTR